MMVVPPPRPIVRIGARKLVLAPNTPSPLTGWPQPVQRVPAVQDEPLDRGIDTSVEPVSPTETTPLPEPPAPVVSDPAAPKAQPRRRQRVVYMAGVAMVLAAVNGVTYFNRTSEPASPRPPVQLTTASQSDSEASVGAVSEDLAVAAFVESAPEVDSPAATLSSMELGRAPLMWLSAPPRSWRPAPLQDLGSVAAERDFSRRWWASEQIWQIDPPHISDAGQSKLEPATHPTGALQIVCDRSDWQFRLIDELDQSRVVAPGLNEALPRGEYVLEFSQPGWAPIQEKVIITSDDTTTVTPQFATGRLLVQTFPDGAEVFLNGRLVGRTPFELRDQPAGAFEMVLSLPDHDDVRLGGDVMGGATTELSFQLDRLDRLARVSELITPPIATVRVAPNFRRLPLVRPGRVLLSFIIDRTGAPSFIRVEDASDRRLIEPCLDVITKWQFSPGINREGKPVNTRVHQLFQVAWAD
jgi:hypothetical protein